MAGCFATTTGKLDGRIALASVAHRQSRHAHFDEGPGQFQPVATGPFEGGPAVHDEGTSHEHFTAAREIKLRNRGFADTVTSYREHYPGHPVEAATRPTNEAAPGLRFTADSTYALEHGWKEAAPGVLADLGGRAEVGWLPFKGCTTYSAVHTGFPVEAKARRAPLQPKPTKIDFASFLRDAHTTTSQGTTSQAELGPKELPELVPAGSVAPVVRAAFDAATEYQAEFEAKEARPFLPHLAGTQGEGGLELPGPRKSLGVQFWHRGEPSRLYCMLPYNVPAPCSASQVFTTVRDNETTASIIIRYGEGTSIEGTRVLGQLDLAGIPPAAHDVPRIEVRFALCSTNRLSVQVRDLDTARQKQWLQRGGVTLTAAGDV